MVFLGTYEVWKWLTAIGAFGVVLAAGYILWTAQRVFFGPEKPRFTAIGDVTLVEAAPLAGMIAAIMIVGIYPAFVTDFFDAGLAPIVDLLGAAGG
ncbi:MAG: hypothetical protein IIB12_09250 [Chloroflexi bacterium]|nr:hypothetical protein [Chloroflexota bacterium]